MELQQIQRTQLNQYQLQSLTLLQMSSIELDAYVQELSFENPFVELREPEQVPYNNISSEFLQKMQWLSESDWQNRYYEPMKDDEELDPLIMIGTSGGFEDTLPRHLMRQLAQLNLDAHLSQAVLYLIMCLDDDGYLRTPPEDFAADSGFTAEELRKAKSMLCSFEPAGVGAATLSECLTLQLERMEGSALAIQIVKNDIENLARGNYHAIAKNHGVADDAVIAAAEIIRSLDPRPGAIFKDMQPTPFIRPDLYVTEENGALTLHPAIDNDQPFMINQQYLRILKTTADAETKNYLTEKLSHAKSVLQSIKSRTSTVLRCAERILVYQTAFFHQGAEALRPLRVEDIARELGVHSSTVSRAVHAKYLECSHGIFPLSFFFMHSAGENSVSVGNAAARALLRRLIEEEDKAFPLSDQKLCQLMQERGCEISRRTVAKYREEMTIPSARQRKQHMRGA